MLDSVRWRIILGLRFNGFGFHYKTVARSVFGNGSPRYEPTNAEVAIVGKVAREEGLSPLPWRRGETPEARQLLKAMRDGDTSHVTTKFIQKLKETLDNKKNKRLVLRRAG